MGWGENPRSNNMKEQSRRSVHRESRCQRGGRLAGTGRVTVLWRPQDESEGGYSWGQWEPRAKPDEDSDVVFGVRGLEVIGPW